jgi:CBS domain-containing protein
MTSEVVTLQPEMTLREAVEVLSGRHISGAPVVEGTRVVGMFSSLDAIEFLATNPGVPDVVESQQDSEDSPAPDEQLTDTLTDAQAEYYVDYWSDAGADVAQRFRDVRSPVWDVLAEHTVGEAMSRRLLVLPPDADVRAAADAMQRTHAHRVVVLDKSRLVGIVSALDIARAVAEHRLAEQRVVYTTKPSQLS